MCSLNFYWRKKMTIYEASVKYQIPYGKLRNVYMMMYSLEEAVEVCLNSNKYLNNFKSKVNVRKEQVKHVLPRQTKAM